LLVLTGSVKGKGGEKMIKHYFHGGYSLSEMMNMIKEIGKQLGIIPQIAYIPLKKQKEMLKV